MSRPDDGPVSFFTHDHRQCDQLWADFENAVDSGEGAAELWESFDQAMRRHMAMEEEVLFPALEEATGMAGGPTAVMRMEHDQMRSLLNRLSQLARDGDWEVVADGGDTLMMLIGQHNAKEEGMLYPLAERALSPSWTIVAGRLSRYGKAD